jgi:hypothetical protein
MSDLKDKLVIVSILAFVLSVLFLTNTVTSGYHFIDDHEVIKIKSELSVSSLNTVTKNWVLKDLKNNERFRPFYYIHRVFETKLFGSDFFLWSLYNGFLWYLALILFYIAARNLKFPLAESIVFIVIIFIGPQSSVLWRLGPGESLGMALLGLAFYFMSKVTGLANFRLYNPIFAFFLILASLTKESFLIIIPAMVIFKVWNESISIWSSVKESVNNNLILSIPLIVCAAELFIIKNYIGMGYSGLESNLLNNVHSISITGLHFAKTYLYLLITGLVLLIICVRNKKFNLLPSVFFLLIIAPNILLYAKSGLEERYLLPSTLGLSFFVVSLIRGIDKNLALFKKMALTLVLILLLPYMGSTISEAIKFAKEGKSTGSLLSAIRKNNVQGSQVLVIADPVESYEMSVSLKTYLFYEDNIDLYGFVLVKIDNSPDYQGYVEGWKSYFKGSQYENMTSKPGLLIFLDSKMVDDFFSKSNLPRNIYVPVEIGKSPYALLKSIVPAGGII